MDDFKNWAMRYEASEAISALGEASAAITKWRDNIEAGASLEDLAVNYFYIKTLHGTIDGILKNIGRVKEALDKGILPEKMDLAGLDLFRVPGVARSFSVQERISASVIDKPKAFSWLRGIGQGDLITETVNAGTLSSFVKNLMVDEGIEPPDDAIRVNTYRTTSINKYTPK